MNGHFMTYSLLIFLYDRIMTDNIKNEKLDKRAAALRDNLKRRKAKAKINKNKSNKESKDGTTQSK